MQFSSCAVNIVSATRSHWAKKKKKNDRLDELLHVFSRHLQYFNALTLLPQKVSESRTKTLPNLSVFLSNLSLVLFLDVCALLR